MFTAQTEWDCPESFPDLSDAKYIAIDLETKDPDLKSKGSGAIQGHGEIVGALLWQQMVGKVIILLHTKVVVIWIEELF